uniref:C2 domain-containing protein n=1 Tax=Romanomermis culicivorax TaxID=13658 RepID=A0A915IW11_ROMCU
MISRSASPTNVNNKKRYRDENDDYATKSATAPPPPPSPSPNKFPKTNPRFKAPATFSSSSTSSAGGEEKPSTAAMNENANKMRRLLHGLKHFGIKGELYISLLLQRRLLTITIDQARNLIPPDGSSCCNCYVRVCLVPDDEKRTQCKTEQVCFSNKPVYNQTFTIELLPEDRDKRILISMWHRPTSFERSQIDGWYFLLSPSYGKYKHLAVHKVTMLTFYGSLEGNNNNNNNEEDEFTTTTKATTTPVTTKKFLGCCSPNFSTTNQMRTTTKRQRVNLMIAALVE